MAREITLHHDPFLRLLAVDGPGAGGASHKYQVLDVSRENLHPSGDDVDTLMDIQFQDGPIKENGVNGLTNEVLLAVVIDRLQGFQGGAYRCRENAIALTKIEEALMWLQARTRDRIARGVEGTHQV